MPDARRCLAAIGLFACFGGGAQAVQHSVVVADNFFSPATLTIEVGDTVRWTNSAGFHNVFSCTADQVGCDGATANEVFSNGPPRNGPWFYSYTFTSAGENPYLCQSHASFMHGHITVVGAPGGPPAVPDGRSGEPMTADKSDAQGVGVAIAWDEQSCPAIAYNLLYGNAAGLPDTPSGSYTPAGQLCGIESPLAWTDAPALTGPGDWIWWLIVATDGATTEGAWGANAAGERAGPGAGGASGVCGITTKDARGDCAP